MKRVSIATTMLAPPAHADDANQLTKITLNAPLRIPGNRDLIPGTYWLKLLDSKGNRSVVTIYNADQTQVEATLMTVAAYRPNYSGTEFTLAEQSRTAPDVLVNWFYPGDHIGHEFVYSSKMEQRLDNENMINVFPQHGVVG